MKPAGLLFLAALGGCTPQARSVEYFEANPEEAVRIAARCLSGEHRGDECQNANAAIGLAERRARMDRYEQNF